MRTEESGRREVTVIDGFKQESMYGMSAKKRSRCREVADVGGVQTRVSVWTVRQKSGRCK